MVESESSFGAYVCHRRPGGSRATSDLVVKERGACRSWPIPAYCANERLRYKNDHVSWSHLLVGQLFGKKKKKTAKMVKKKKEKKRNSLYSLRDFGSFRDAVFIPGASNEDLSKIHLAFERE